MSVPIAAGIFNSENGQRLLQILLQLGDRGFEGLYHKCKSNIHGDYYQLGLRRVHMWSDSVLNEDITFITTQCPDFEETFESCFVEYVTDRYRSKSRPTLKCPRI